MSELKAAFAPSGTVLAARAARPKRRLGGATETPHRDTAASLYAWGRNTSCMQRLACPRLRVRAAASKHVRLPPPYTYGCSLDCGLDCSLHHLRLQPASRTVAACTTYGCSLHPLRRQVWGEKKGKRYVKFSSAAAAQAALAMDGVDFGGRPMRVLIWEQPALQ